MVLESDAAYSRDSLEGTGFFDGFQEQNHVDFDPFVEELRFIPDLRQSSLKLVGRWIMRPGCGFTAILQSATRDLRNNWWQFGSLPQKTVGVRIYESGQSGLWPHAAS